MKTAYGYTIGPDDPFVQLAEEASKISGWATAPGRWLVDYYPIGLYMFQFLSLSPPPLHCYVTNILLSAFCSILGAWRGMEAPRRSMAQAS